MEEMPQPDLRAGQQDGEAKMEERAAKKIRNICILAHVDHGKTTLADHLIAAAGGGVLHAKQAGKLRYLDYRDDEQQRAITMKSSSIALRFRGYMINLIDSPGHIDFCSEVSTAVRLSDGALVLVDVCEGVHIQTHAVLRQAWTEHVAPCLVLNKIDRLITELKLTPVEAYMRMQNIVAEVNNIISAFRSEKYLSDVDSILAGPKEILEDSSQEQDEVDEFSVEKGNIAFASAGDGWAFRIEQFANLYAAKLGASGSALKKALWGDFFYSPKTKKIVGKKASGGKLKPMFVQFILEPLWQAYDAALQSLEGVDVLSKIIKSMNLTIPPRDLQHKDPKVVIQAVMSRWLPLAENILSMVVVVLPDPATAQPTRMTRLLSNPKVPSDVNDDLQAELEVVRRAVETCDESIEAPCVVFVSKMFAVPLEMLPRYGPHGELFTNFENEVNEGDIDAAHQECFLAFARVFSGVLSTGQTLLVLSALHDPTEREVDERNIHYATADALYMMMGRGLEPKSVVSAGNVVAIRGLGQHILKSATLSTTTRCWPFASMNFQAAPIVRVAIETSDPTDMGALARGLRLLNRADPFVEVSLSASGEHVIAAAGEVHLERCIKDLRERFARVELEVSPPLVAFRETIEEEDVNQIDGSKPTPVPAEYVESTTPNGRCTVRVHVTRLPIGLTQMLDEHADLLRHVVVEKSGSSFWERRKGVLRNGAGNFEDPVAVLKSRLVAAVDTESASNNSRDDKPKRSEDTKWREKLERIWALGPRQLGPNLLLKPSSEVLERNPTVSNNLLNVSVFRAEVAVVRGSARISEKLGLIAPTEHEGCSQSWQAASASLLMEAESLENSVVSGFQLATAAGPLCEEPMWGLAFDIEAFITGREDGAVQTANGIHEESGQAKNSGVDRYGPFSGQVMTVVKEACRSAMLAKQPRIVEAMYFCELSTTAEHLGQSYAVLGKRRAHILKEEMREGTGMFTVHAFMPVAESFGFADELRRKTSGAASPQLMLSHWEPLSQDPFFVPRTEEELEEFGDGSSVPLNTARKLIDAVRRRKGLPVEEKVVPHATKQRTLARKV
ncbi:hypothetical protein O6H91_04G126800 [Diphasiastrum complanatum]|uniref:Uncharacterized protein n=1 Tax=Diphasiastrum complanatum TaxID=34168 RepID=A0ACC2E186_DIPCM|nr:hypothetical protein O6H91_04G126800 [Diphasiastrum complanatum]